MHSWVGDWEHEVAAADLAIPLAKSFAAYLGRTDDGVADLVGARQRDGAELLLLQIRTGRPQQPACDIRLIEPVGVYFPTDDGPRVLALREDFPDTPHQNLMPPELPFSLCIDDRPWSEARLTYTPAELLERVVLWFRKAGRGELHDAAQPLDPIFIGHGFEIILPRSVWTAPIGERAELVGYVPNAARPRHLIAKPLSDALQEMGQPAIGLVVLAYDLSAQPMARLRRAPSKLDLLQNEMVARGLDLVSDLVDRIAAWQKDEVNRALRLCSRLCILLRIPIIHPVTGATGAMNSIAFVTDCTVGEIGELLGVLWQNDSGEGKQVSYVDRVPAGQPQAAKVGLEMALVHTAFDAELASSLAGRNGPDQRRVVLIGAGAIGSMLSEALAREGDFASWAIIDHDTFLPHNGARHTLTAMDVGREKATALAERLRHIRPDIEAIPFDEDFLKPLTERASHKLNQADVIIDASASVPVSRRLGDLPGSARRLSIFFNPSGTAAVLLAEDTARRIDLRMLEAVYHSEVQRNEALRDHLRGSGMLPYSGACRSLTSRIPASSVQTLSGIAAHGIRQALDTDAATVRVWTMHENGTVTLAAPSTSITCRTVGDWTVSLPDDLDRHLCRLRADHLPAETGGALLGIIDIEARRVEIVQALPAPPDSVGSPSAFVRGTDGLKSDVERAIHRSLDQVRYVGEWHTHPRGHSALPSLTDLGQVAWLAATLSADGFPGVMLIVSENSVGLVIGKYGEEQR